MLAEAQGAEGGASSSSKGSIAATTATPGPKTSILLTCKAWVVGGSGEQRMARIFLDSGSEVSLIRRDLANRMGLSGPSHQLSLTGVGGIILPTTQE